MKQVNILLADSHTPLRSAIRLWLEVQLDMSMVEEVKDMESLLAAVAETPPDILLLDWELPGIHSYDDISQLLRTLNSMAPAMKVIALSMYPEVETYAHKAGFRAFASKAKMPEQLLDALEQVIDME